ncbi:MAG: DUF4238 domain-containing protein [Gammaproteobacteria bacterium]|nr:DUF4238 domain-containing protein [Gammaproteobacteria bacterium]
MSTKTKKPHFVPAAYLQFWDVEGEPKGRDSSIYWCNGSITTKQSVKKVAVESGLYSKDDSNSAEDFFGEFESDWSKLIKQLLSGRGPSKEVLAGLLLLQSSYLLLRNPKLSNKSNTERIDAYKKAIEGYYIEVLMGGVSPETKRDSLTYLSKIWSCFLIPSSDDPWITSDNPTLILSYGIHTPALIFLPISPKWAVIALKNDILELSSKKITSKDVEYLNSYTAINSIRQIYSNAPFSEEENINLAKWFKLRPETESYLGVDEVHFESFMYPVSSMELTFIAALNKSSQQDASKAGDSA